MQVIGILCKKFIDRIEVNMIKLKLSNEIVEANKNILENQLMFSIQDFLLGYDYTLERELLCEFGKKCRTTYFIKNNEYPIKDTRYSYLTNQTKRAMNVYDYTDLPLLNEVFLDLVLPF